MYCYGSMKQSVQWLVRCASAWCVAVLSVGAIVLSAQTTTLHGDESNPAIRQSAEKSFDQPVRLSTEALQSAMQTSVQFRGELLYNIVLSNGAPSADGFTPAPTVIPVYRQPKGAYIENVVMVKTKRMFSIGKGATTLGTAALQGTLAAYSVSNVRHIFPQFGQGKLASSDEQGISRWYEVRYSAPFDVYDVCKDLMKNPDVEAAEPSYVYQLAQNRVVPNDPLYTQQYEWQRIQAEFAWAITQGNPNLVIAIVDSGGDVNHEDLASKIWTNPGETGNDAQGRDRRTNGIDDDGNGKVDDWRGWDFVGNVNANERGLGIFRQNNFPFSRRPNLATGDGQNHGVHVAGSAAGAGNNGTGGASAAQNCRIMAIKCSSDDPLVATSVFNGYEGIMYAAEMGASVINCSWGGGAASVFGQNVVYQATAMGSLVVAAAGNSGVVQDVAQYPADFFPVLSVGASDIRDLPVNTANGHFFGSNFGIGTDVWAPGFNILSTVSENRYAVYSGTSMASPITAGIAALVRSVNPTWTPTQVKEHIRTTSDNILASTGATTRPIQQYGRLNAFRAVTANRAGGASLPGISHNERVLVASPTGIVNTSAPTQIRLVLQNFVGLSAATNVRVNIVPVTVSPLARVFDRLAVQSPDVQIASLAPGQTANADFTVQLLPGAFTGTGTRRIDLLMTITADGGYVNYERVALFYDVANPTSTNQVAALAGQIDFPASNEPTTVPTILRNIGTGPFVVTSATFSGTTASEFALTSALDVATPLATATNRAINVTMRPQSAGTKSATLTLNGVLAPTPIQAYTFSSSAGTYSEITDGTVYRNASNTLLDDEEFVVRLPFVFTYGGVRADSLRLSSNGFIGVNVAGLTPLSNALVSTVAASGIIAPFNRDLVQRADGELRSTILGTAPNRVFVAQWTNFSFFVSGTTLPNTRFNFQVRLYETSNRIEVIYGTMQNDAVLATNPLTIYTVQAGLRGASNADFNNREVVFGGASSWVNSLRGATNAATLAVLSNPPAANANAIPPSGLTYTWLPGTGSQTNLPTFTTTAPITATVPTTAPLLRTTSASIAFGTVTLGQTLIRPVVLQNLSTLVPINNINLVLTGEASSDYRIVSTTTTISSLAPNSTVTVLVEFRPSVVGSIGGNRKAELVATVQGGQQVIVDLRGAGAGVVGGSTAQRILRAGFGAQADLGAPLANISLDVSPLPRLGTFVNSTTLTLRNRGTQTIVVSSATFSGLGASEYSILTPFPITIPTGASVPMVIRFTPTIAGEKFPLLSFTGNMDDNITLRIVSAGTLPRFLNITPRTATTVLNSTPQELYPINMPTVPVGGFTTAGTITLTNSTGTTATVSSIEFTGANAGDFSVFSGVPVTLAPGQTQTVRFRFAPTAAGYRTALLTLRHTAPGLQTETIQINGTAITSRQLGSSTVNAWTMTANVGGAVEATGFTVFNRGSDTVRITRVYLAGRNANEFSIATGGTATLIAPGTSVVFGVRFAPTSPGSKSVSLMMESNADQPIWNIVNVSGTATGGLLTPISSTANLGDTLSIAIRVAGLTNPFNTALAQHTGLVRFPAGSFEPLNADQQGVIRNGVRFIRFTIASVSVLPADSVVLRIPVRVLLPLGTNFNDFLPVVSIDSLQAIGAGVGLSAIGGNFITVVNTVFLPQVLFNSTVNVPLRIYNGSATAQTPQFTVAAPAGATASMTMVPNAPIPPNGIGTAVLQYNAATPGQRLFTFTQVGAGTYNGAATTVGGTLQGPTLAGRPGDTVVLSFSLTNIINPQSLPFMGLTARVRFNASLLEPIDPARRGTVSNGVRTLTYSVADLPAVGTLTIPCRVGLGSDTATAITIDNIVTPQGALGFVPANGNFSLRGVNRAGGNTRIIVSPRSTLAVTAISPNPSNGILQTTLTTQDDQVVSIVLRDLSGTEVKRFAPRTVGKGDTFLTLDCSFVASGSYMLTLATAEDAVSVPVVVVK